MSPLSVWLVVVTVAIGVAPPSRNTRYPATPEPVSVEAVQVIWSWVADSAMVLLETGQPVAGPRAGERTRQLVAPRTLRISRASLSRVMCAPDRR